MADIKINDLVAYTDPVSTDVLPIVDVGNDLTKKVSIADLLENAGTGSATAPSFSFDGDNNTGIYRPGADQVALTAGGTQALLAESTGITIPGNLTVSGTTTTVDTVNLTVKDKNIELGVVSTPSNTTADGGGITLKGATDKTINWVNSTGCWTFNQPTNFNDHVRIDSSGNVGIGTSSPGRRLQVHGGGSAIIGSLKRTDGATCLLTLLDNTTANDTHVGIGASANNLLLRAGDAERLRIDSSGNVGIGTTSPGAALDVVGNSTMLRLYDGTNQSVGKISQSGNVITFSQAGTSNGALAFATGAGALGTERLRIDSSGRVGIGTSSPTTTLHVDGTATVDRIINATTGSDPWLKGVNGSGTETSFIKLDGQGYLTKLGIGTTAPAYLLDIKATSTPTIRIQETTNGPEGRFLASASDVQIGTYGGSPFSFYVNSTERARIDTSGRLLVGTSTNIENQQIQSASTGGNNFGASRFTNGVGGCDIFLTKSRGATVGTHTVVQSGDDLGNLYFRGSDGSSYVSAARISVAVDGTPGANDMPGRLVFSTTADGASSPTERLRIDSSGNVGIGISTPVTALDVTKSDASGVAAHIRVNNSESSAGISLVGTGSSFSQPGWAAISDAGLVKSSSGASNGLALQSTVGPLSFWRGAGTALQSMQIDSSGRLLVGTTVAGQEDGDDLTIAPYQGGDSNAGITIRSGTTRQGSIYFADGTSGVDTYRGYISYKHSDEYMVFATNNNERLRIDSSGNVGIGTLPNDVDSIGRALNIASSTGGAIYLQDTDSLTGKFAAISYNGSTTGLQIHAHHPSSFIDFGTNGTERMRIDSSGNVGIGTSSPNNYSGYTTLTLNHNTTGSVLDLEVNGTRTGTFFADTTQVKLGTQTSSPLVFRTDSTERMQIDSSGNVGIGTTSLGHKLVVNQNNSGGIAAIHLPQDESTILGYHSTTYLKFGGNMTVGAASSIIFENAGSEAARIDSSRRMLLGVSSSSADARLVVAGSTTPYDSQILMASTGNQPSVNTKIGGIKWSDNRHDSAIGGEIALWSDSGWSNNTQPSRLVFSVTGLGESSPTERMRIDSSGKLLVGTTTAYGRIHADEAGMNPDGTGWLNAAFVASGSFGGGLAFLDGSKGYSVYAADGGNDFFIRGHTSTTGSGAGGVKINNRASSWTSASDERDKENLIPITQAVDKIKTLRAVTGNYTWDPDTSCSFLIAQDVQQVLPEAVSVMNKQAATEDQRLGLAYSQVIPLLTSALQEAIAKIETLEQRLTDAGIA